MNENVKLTYHGRGHFIMGIPARNLTDYDLETIAKEFGSTVEDVLETLTLTSMYKRTDLFICAECGKIYKTWAAMSKHELEHIKKMQATIETELTGEEQDDG